MSSSLRSQQSVSGESRGPADVPPLACSLNAVAQIMNGPYFADGTAMSAEVSRCIRRGLAADIGAMCYPAFSDRGPRRGLGGPSSLSAVAFGW